MAGRRTVAGALIAAMLLVLAVLPGGGPAFVSVALAQQDQQQQSRGGLLRFLFQRNDPPQRVREVPRRTGTQRRTQPSARSGTRARTPAPAVAATPEVEKAADARKVLVVGDFLAGGLADGLETAYAQNAKLVVVDRSNGSSGLVRDDFYDWPGSIEAILDEEQPAVVVVMIGSNDRQQMVVDGARQDPLTEGWTKEYERRAEALAKAIRERDVPLIWVGNLPFKSGSMTSGMLAFNDVYGRVAQEVGGEFVDVWDGFVDENGKFVTNGPDMNGQPAQLRASDGINVTQQGRRKIAFYVEKPLSRMLGDLGEVVTPGGAEAFGPPIPKSLQVGTPDAPRVIERTQPVALGLQSPAGPAALVGAYPAPRAVSPPASGSDEAERETSARERLLIDGIAPESRPGRADDFANRRKSAPASDTETPARVDRDETTSITR